MLFGENYNRKAAEKPTFGTPNMRESDYIYYLASPSGHTLAVLYDWPSLTLILTLITSL